MTTSDRGRQSPDQAASGGSARYGDAEGARGSGHLESKQPERKDEGWVSRQGGDQSEHGTRSGQPKAPGPKGKAER
jgi:hypothetical protein